MADCSMSSPAASISKMSSSSIVMVVEKGSRGNLCWVTRTYTKLLALCSSYAYISNNSRAFSFQLSLRSAPIRMSSTFLRLFNCCCRPIAVRRYASSAYAQPRRGRFLGWSSVLVISAGLAFGTPYKIYLDSQPNVVEDTIGDPQF